MDNTTFYTCFDTKDFEFKQRQEELEYFKKIT